MASEDDLFIHTAQLGLLAPLREIALLSCNPAEARKELLESSYNLDLRATFCHSLVLIA